jgi:disulfide bond formation protein DsbB
MKRTSYLTLALLTLLILSLAACGGGGSTTAAEAPRPPAGPAGDAAAGAKIFASTCAACHGPAGQGVQGLGKDMTASQFIAEKSDAELIAFIKVGRDPSDPLNTTGVAMPPKGGNPALNDTDLANVIAFVRSLQK